MVMMMMLMMFMMMMMLSLSFEWNESSLVMFKTCAEGAIYSVDYISTFTSLVKNRRAAADFLDAPQLAEEIKAIGELYAAEMKEKQKQLKAAMGDETLVQSEEEEEATSLLIKLVRWFITFNACGLIVGFVFNLFQFALFKVICSTNHGVPKEGPADPIKTTFTHMLVDNATPELPIKKDAKGDEINKLNEKLMQFKKIAQRKVPWFSHQQVTF